MAHEEVATLLSNEQTADVRRTRQSKMLRTIVGVAGAAVVVAGAVVAVSMNQTQAQPSFETTSLHAIPHAATTPTFMEAQFGWGTIENGWCSLRASTACLFSSDKEKCKEEVHAKCDVKEDENEGEHEGAGSGSGSHVGPEVGHEKNGTKHHKKHKKHHKKKHHATAEPSTGHPETHMPAAL